MAYTGPKNIVIIGGGISGLAAADAITESLTSYVAAGNAIDPIKITVLEGESQVGGRATTWDVNAIDPDEHPQRHLVGHTPHGIHFFWHSYRHFAEWTKDFPQAFSPDVPTSTYNMWITPPDLPADFDHPGQVVAVHVVDPMKPNTAWDPRAGAILEAMLKRESWATKLEDFVRTHFAEDIAVNDWLAFLDLLFDEKHISPQLRWGIFFGPIFAASVGRVETNLLLRDALGGREPQDVEVGELVQPFFETVIVKRLKSAHDALAPFLEGQPQPTSIAPVDAAINVVRDVALKLAEGAIHAVESLFGAGGVDEKSLAALELFRLIMRDARVLMAQTDFDPRESGYLKNLYKAAFSSPYSFDLATAMRDIQMGHRNHQCAMLQVFDGDDAQSLWNHIRDRILARKTANIDVEFKLGTWATEIKLDANEAVTAVAWTDVVTREKRPVSMVDPAVKGANKGVIPADAVVCTVLPACAKPLLPKTSTKVRALRRRLDVLGQYANETVNLQLFFPRKMKLPFVDGPLNASSASTIGESRPFSISNLEGPFTILVDLERAWRASTFAKIKLDAAQIGDFAGSAWELVGAWGDAFTHDDHASPSRAQWPVGMQRALIDLAHNANDFEPWSIDGRPWVVDAKRLAPPAFGQVRPEKRAAYFTRWVTEVGPLVVEQTLRILAQLPGLEPDDADHLKDVAILVGKKQAAPVKWVFTKSAQAETKFHSSEPRLYDFRPHARFEELAGLWFAGDWTRSGLNVQAMEGALISGLQSAAGVLEAMRAGGFDAIRGPRIRPDVVPNGAWDAGP